MEYRLVFDVEYDQVVAGITCFEHSNDAIEFLGLYECNCSDPSDLDRWQGCALDRSRDALHVDRENDIRQVFPVLG